MRLLTESKRDDLLLPYVEILKQHGIEAPLGAVKKALLKRFQQFGGFSNLSLGSNYYLAGVAKYYFNGDLTVNKDLGIYDDSEDTFNRDVCVRLNALILILRNTIVDSLGEKFEQPEDFGELSLKKLLRKYGAKIDDALGIERKKRNKEENAEVDSLDRNPSVGNGTYTFDIMYSFHDCEKYNPYTRPGAWCITYGQQHYNYYVRALGIHYVIFKKEGFEQVPRIEEKEMWKNDGGRLPKPQDTYGNSLIALLQSNTNGEPVYITSRWNHGYETSVEADHAYTKEEFMQITGVSDADLQRIFEIWKKDSSKTKRGREYDSAAAKEQREHKLKILRALKYDQMRINGGENPAEVFKDHLGNVLPSKVIAGNGKANKSILDVEFDVEGERYHALVDRGNILFDTIISSNDYMRGWRRSYDYSEATDSEGQRNTDSASKFNNIIVVRLKEHSIMLYNTRLHQFVSVGGLKKFKYVDQMRDRDGNFNDSYYYEIRETNNQIALVDAKTNVPLKLPNGEYWFESISNNDWRNYWGREVRPRFINSNRMYVICYDSAMKKYFYFLPAEKRFINIDPSDGSSEEIHAGTGQNIRRLANDFSIISIGNWSTERYKIYKGDKLVSLNGVSTFGNISFIDDRFFVFIPYKEGYKNDGEDEKRYCFDVETQSYIGLHGQPLKFQTVERIGYEGWGENNPANYLAFYTKDLPEKEGDNNWNWRIRGSQARIYSIKDNAFLINPLTNSEYFLIHNRRDNSYETNNRFQVYDTASPMEYGFGTKEMDADEIRETGRMIKGEVLARITPEDDPFIFAPQAENAAVNESIIPITNTDIENMVNEALRKIFNIL